MRLSLGELEEAIRDPALFKTKLKDRTNPDNRPFIPKSYYNPLRYAIFKYHETKNPIKGEEYLAEKLSAFKSETRKKEIFDQYEWYIKEFQDNKRINFGFRQRIVLRPTADLVISGEISRLDLGSRSGYEAWLFRSKDPDGWFNELRMPLIQDNLSKSMLAMPGEIQVGIYSFQERFIDQRSYSTQEIENSYKSLSDILSQLDLM